MTQRRAGSVQVCGRCQEACWGNHTGRHSNNIAIFGGTDAVYVVGFCQCHLEPQAGWRRTCRTMAMAWMLQRGPCPHQEQEGLSFVALSVGARRRRRDYLRQDTWVSAEGLHSLSRACWRPHMGKVWDNVAIVERFGISYVNVAGECHAPLVEGATGG